MASDTGRSANSGATRRFPVNGILGKGGTLRPACIIYNPGTLAGNIIPAPIPATSRDRLSVLPISSRNLEVHGDAL